MSDVESEDLAIPVCPTGCSDCVGPGACEDCLVCLYWPDPVPDSPARQRPASGLSHPSHAADLERQRASLSTGDAVGMAIRAWRGQRGLSQRALAAELGRPKSTVARIERGAHEASLGLVAELLTDLGLHLAVVDEAGRTLTAEAWGAEHLLAVDAAGRRLPPHGQATWRDELTRWGSLDGRYHQGEWTWQRPPVSFGQPAEDSTRGRRSSGGQSHDDASASTCSPERMSLTWSPDSPAPGNQTKGMPRRSA